MASIYFARGAKARGFFIIRLGAVNVHRVSADGAEKVIHVFRAGQIEVEGKRIRIAPRRLEEQFPTNLGEEY